MKLNFIQKTLDNQGKMRNNVILSQNSKAVTPNCQNWLFYCLKSAINHLMAHTPAERPSYLGKIRLSDYVGVIVQNKPIGEYAQRLLWKPRVNPNALFFGLSQTLKKSKGVQPMNKIKQSFLANLPYFIAGNVLGLLILAALVKGGAL